ncbi:MAG TPA: hypothetical protein VFB03_02945 [Candidatus Saccharimonadales bacterium]|nr:hypothetical protein [Candidatus Saccharimonadales bacterium]
MIELGPVEVTGSHTGVIELFGRPFEIPELELAGRLMLVQTVKPPAGRIEVYFDDEDGPYDGRQLVKHGDELDILPAVHSDQTAEELILSALDAIDDEVDVVQDETRQQILERWPELGDM